MRMLLYDVDIKKLAIEDAPYKELFFYMENRKLCRRHKRSFHITVNQHSKAFPKIFCDSTGKTTTTIDYFWETT